ncbi:WD40 repeat-like protein [Exidia glandulosa HHB12029]|uniref:WD40 repeat-like protein n=1 Tax=Exidia glandulosa HHB12029 TaxID=1314781 RepID=A0A165HM70_EXIGL|nr:WD40 repeat-like protein [Exidia glandulosa HHB12029]
MKLSELEHAPASATASLHNGHGDGAVVATNGHASSSRGAPAGSHLHNTPLFDSSTIDRHEFVRLMIQALRDTGYPESAASLEAESGYALEAPHVAAFRRAVLDGAWDDAVGTLEHIGLADAEDLRATRFLLSQQKYLELLEQQEVAPALLVLRGELAPYSIDQEKLHSLSSLMMCASAHDLRERAKWDGAAGTSRRRLLQHVQTYIPASVMLPPRRLPALLEQARAHQRRQCLYHTRNVTISLLEDHVCSRADFPVLTTHILAEHEDEVWHVQWSHDGRSLASASKDRNAIIWSIGPETGPAERECNVDKVLRDHDSPVTALAWSLDDSILLTSSEMVIKMWNAKTGVCIRELKKHDEPVSSLVYLPDGAGFVSGGMDRKIIIWDNDGSIRDAWPLAPIRVCDLTVSPDGNRLVAVGLLRSSESATGSNSSLPLGAAGSNGVGNTQPTPATSPKRKIVVYDLKTRQELNVIEVIGELTSVRVSRDSRYAIINHAPDEVHLWDLQSGRLARKFTGQRQGQHIIRSCFGGDEDSFVLSGSEDGNVYVWHRDTGVLLEVLAGHGEGSVNSVGWNPREPALFASCSDDHTIRIWEAPPPGIPDFDRERERERERIRALVAASEDIDGLTIGTGGKGKGRSA